MTRRIVIAAGLLLSCLPAFSSWAHKPSDSYLWIEAEEADLALRWDVALIDLEHALGLDGTGDGSITWGEVRNRETQIRRYALERLRVQRSGVDCTFREQQPLMIAEHSDGRYAVLQYGASCGEVRGPLSVDYRLLFDLDPTHRGLLVFRGTGGEHAAVLGPDNPIWNERSGGGSWQRAVTFFQEGVRHIWIGYDHIAFLLLLLLPAGLIASRAVPPRSRVRTVGIDALQVVTAFTVAHSVTLALAATGTVTLPAKLVEIAIAASVIAAGLCNVALGLAIPRWLLALGFGLIHGFGFANVLADLGLAGGSLAVPLAAFNVGVEAGQLAIVAVALPFIAWWSTKRWYRRRALPIASLTVAALASLWLIDRASG